MPQMAPRNANSSLLTTICKLAQVEGNPELLRLDRWWMSVTGRRMQTFLGDPAGRAVFRVHRHAHQEHGQGHLRPQFSIEGEGHR